MSEGQRFVFHVEEGGDQRLDKYLVTCLPEHSRARIQALIKAGHVRVDDNIVQKTGYKLDGGERVILWVPPPVPSELIPEAIPLEVIFENQDLLVVNKPAGMVVHPAAGHSSGTLVHAALAHAPDIKGVGGEVRPGVVHRLDKDTSGVILLAKHDAAHRFIQEQFRERTVEKVYLALVDGHPPTPTGRVEAPIGRDPSQRKQMAVVPVHKGREAISQYRTLESFPHHALLEIKPRTGRTHQIRVHMAFLECPVSGDRQYGRRKPSLPLKRHFLHAFSLAVHLPGETQPYTFTAPLPDELERVLAQLRHLLP